jgi:hypothetical protein
LQPEVRQIVDYKDHLLSQRAIPKVKWPCKIEKNSEPSQHADSRGLADGSLTMPQRKKARQRYKLQVNNHSKNPTTNLNCHASLREELTKQLLLKDRRKKTTNTCQTTNELLLKYQHQDWMLEE